MKQLVLAILPLLVLSDIKAEEFKLTSSSMQHGSFMDKAQEFKGFGCSGGNLSPQLTWIGEPEGTKSFAITVYDPDAPTGSGWWHWQVVNVPASVNSLPLGAGSENSQSLPEGSEQMENDYGFKGFGGACPPEGDGAHRYQFKVHALAVDRLELPPRASGALVGYMINANTIESSVMEVLYVREAFDEPSTEQSD